MQLNWLHVKMLDQSMKSKESGYKCNGSVPYDTCMYDAVIKVISVITCDLSWQYCWLPRLWEVRQCRAALFPGFQGITRSAQIRLISTLLTGNIITGLLTNRQDHNLVTQLYSSLLQVDCPNPCAFLSVSAGGQNREEFHSNQSQVSDLSAGTFSSSWTSFFSSQVFFYFQSKTMINEESLLYTALSLFAEIGGQYQNQTKTRMWFYIQVCNIIMRNIKLSIHERSTSLMDCKILNV